MAIPLCMHRVRAGWYSLPVAQQLSLHVFRITPQCWVFGATESHKRFDPDKDALSTWPTKRQATERAYSHYTELQKAGAA